MEAGPDGERAAALRAAHRASRAAAVIALGTLLPVFGVSGFFRNLAGGVYRTDLPWHGHPATLAVGIGWGLRAILTALAAIDLEKSATEGRTSGLARAFRRLGLGAAFLGIPVVVAFGIALRQSMPGKGPPEMLCTLVGVALLVVPADAVVGHAWFRHRAVYRDLAAAPDAGRRAAVVKVTTLSEDLERKGCGLLLAIGAAGGGGAGVAFALVG